jgi:hypothetical protein
LIYQLIKLNGTLKRVFLLALAGAVGSLLLLRDHSSSDKLWSYFIVYYCMWLYSIARIRATTFHISLPIPGRQLFLAHMVSTLSLFWAPPIAAAILASFYNAADYFCAMDLLVTCSIATLCFFILHSADLKEQKAPGDMLFVAISVGILLSLCLQTASIAAPMSVLWAMPVVLVVCLIPSAILFFYIWKNIPKSFLISQTDTAGSRNSYPEESSSIQRSFLYLAWLPTFKSLLLGPFLYEIWVPLLFLPILAGHLSILLLIVLWIASVWSSTRPRIAWVYAFPVSRSLILLLFLVPVFLLIIAGYSAGISIKGFLFPPRLISPMRIKLIHVGLMIAVSLMAIAGVEIMGLLRIRRFGKWVGFVSFALGMTGALAFVAWPGFGSMVNEFANRLLFHISWILPDNSPAAIAIIIASLAGLYWITDKLHRKAECLDILPPKGEAL